LADAVRPIESRALAGFFGASGALDREWAEYFHGCALIISFLYDPDGIFGDNVAHCTEAQYLEGPHRPDEQGDLHATSVLLKPLERLAIFDADPVPRLRIRAGEVKHREADGDERSGRRTVALHPGSGSERKNWPESEWFKFISELLENEDLDLLLVGGEAESERLERLEATFGGCEERIGLAHNLPLVRLAERLSTCSAFVGHDSGITHLASALGLPGLVLWGPSREQIWRPLSERIVLLRAEEGLTRLSVSTVTEGLRQLLATSDGLDNSRFA
jgi:hypothetical protein